MKKIFCELCEGTEFTKDNGMFVCNGCGTRYTAEEARGMMREVEGDSPAVGNPVIGVPVGNPNQAQIDNILLLASNAYSASNNEETEKYCNRAIELDATCYKAWMLKGKAAGWQSTLQNLRIAEAAHSFKQAVDFAPDEEKESLTEEAVEELKRLGLACISLRQKRFSQYPDSEELNGFVSDLKPLIDGLVVLLSKGAEVAQVDDLLAGLLSGINMASMQFIGMHQKARAAGVPNEFFSQIAVMMGNAAIAGYNTTTKKFNSDSRPMPNDFKKTMNEVDNCIMLLEMANMATDDDEDDDIKRLYSKITMEEFCISMTAYADYSSSYRTWSLTDAAKKSRREIISNCRKSIKEKEDKKREKAEEARRKAEEEKQARIAAYWEAHAEEKAALDAEISSLKEKVRRIAIEMNGLRAEIKAATPSGPVPAEDETAKLNLQIKELDARRAKLGMFAGKEKKQIGEEIAALYGRINSLKAKIEEEKKARKKEADKEIAPLQSKYDELRVEHDKATKRIDAIKAELTKDPEE